MKKLFVLTLVALSSFGLFAQEVDILNNVEFGVKGGANYSTISNLNLNVDLNALLGNWHAGIVTRATISDRLGAQAELLYSKKENTFANSLGTKLHYIDLPILGRVNIINDVSLHVGPQFSYMVSIKDDLTFTKDDVKKYDVGIVGGLEYQNGKIFGGGRYDFGFIDIYERTEAPDSNITIIGSPDGGDDGVNNNNKLFQIYIGVMF